MEESKVTAEQVRLGDCGCSDQMTETIDYERLYSAFFRGNGPYDGYMIRVEADNLAEAARIAEETREERGVPSEHKMHLVVHGYGSPRML